MNHGNQTDIVRDPFNRLNIPGRARRQRRRAPKHPPPGSPSRLRANAVAREPNCLVQRLRLRGVQERPFTVRGRHVADALLDFRFDLGVLIEPSDDLLISINGAKMATGGDSFIALFVPKTARD